MTGGKHSLEIRLVRTTPYGEQAERTTDASHAVYRRYQMKIHGDSEEKCALSNWKNFLVESPLMVRGNFVIWLREIVFMDEWFLRISTRSPPAGGFLPGTRMILFPSYS